MFDKGLGYLLMYIIYIYIYIVYCIVDKVDIFSLNFEIKLGFLFVSVEVLIFVTLIRIFDQDKMFYF